MAGVRAYRNVQRRSNVQLSADKSEKTRNSTGSRDKMARTKNDRRKKTFVRTYQWRLFDLLSDSPPAGLVRPSGKRVIVVNISSSRNNQEFHGVVYKIRIVRFVGFRPEYRRAVVITITTPGFSSRREYIYIMVRFCMEPD